MAKERYKYWEVIEYKDDFGNAIGITVVPTNDIIEHEDVPECGCSPTLQILNEIPCIIHNAMDDRERLEDARFTNPN